MAKQQQALRERVIETLEDADNYYTLMIEAGESPNIDSVGYTSSIALDVFRRLLHRPDLQVEELETMLRDARSQVRTEIGPRLYTRIPRPTQAMDPAHNWARLMADIVVNKSNENI
jgi:hypothetical protein